MMWVTVLNNPSLSSPSIPTIPNHSSSPLTHLQHTLFPTLARPVEGGGTTSGGGKGRGLEGDVVGRGWVLGREEWG